MHQLEQSRKFYTGNRADYEENLSSMRQEKSDLEKKIEGLVDSLVDLPDGVARNHVAKRIEQLNSECNDIDARIRELEGLTSQHTLSDIEFDVMRQLLTMFKNGIDEMSIEQKRAAIRTVVRKIVWDGTNAHAVLFGAQDADIEYPDLPHLNSEASDDEDDADELEEFSDVDYEDDDQEENCLGKTQLPSAPKMHWGEDSKRNPDGPSQQPENPK